MADVDITSLSVEISAESQGAELNIDKLATAISNLRTKGNVTKVVNSLDRLSASISALKSASAGLSGLDKLTGFLDKLSGTDLSASTKSINSVGNAIKKIAAVDIGGLDLSGLSGKMSELQSGLSPLAGLDVSGLKGIGSAINALGKIPSLTNKLDSSTLDAFAKACEKISTSLTPLASQLDKVGNAFAKLPPQLSKVVTQANRVTAANEKQRKSYLSLSNQMNGFMRNMAKLVSLKAIAEYLGNAVAKFNDFYEATDMFTVSMGEMTESANQFINKMESLLGIDPTEAMNNMANVYSMVHSFGMASDKAYTLSQNLTQLGYDLASLKNMNPSETFTKLRSAMAGELEPVLQLGVDISQARLQQELLELGFNKQISTLSQADKATLRYIAIMKQLTYVQGNLGETLSSPANMIRILKAQLSGLARDIGSLLYPALKSILPPLIAAVELIREFVQWVSKLMGVKVVFTDFTKSADSVGGIGDAMDDTADSTKKAAKALKDYTMGFDELNIIDPTQGSSDSGSGAGAAGNLLGDVDLSQYDMFKDYAGSAVDEIKEKLKSLDSFQIGTQIGEQMNKLMQMIYDAVHSVDWASLGATIADGINGLVDAVDWDLFGRLLASRFTVEFDLLGGFLGQLDWTSILNAFVNGFSGFFNELTEWIQSKDWSEIGKAVTEKISNALQNVDVGKLTKALFDFIISAINGIADFLSGTDSYQLGQDLVDFAIRAVTSVDWAGLSQAIGRFFGEAFIEALDFMGGLVSRIADYFEQKVAEGPFDNVGLNIIYGIYYGIQDAITNVASWIVENVFNPFINGFKSAFGINSPSTVMAEQGGYIIAGLKKGITDAISSVTETAKKILSAIKSAFDNFSLFDIGKNLIQGLIDGVNNMIETAKNAVANVGNAVIDKVKNVLGIHSPSTVFAEIGGYIDQGLANGINAALLYVEQAMTNLANAVQQKGNEMIDYGATTATNFVDGFFNGLDSKWQELDSGLQNDFFGTVQNLWNAVQTGDLKTIGTTAASIIWQAMGEDNRTEVKTYASDLISQLSSSLKKAAGTLFDSALQIGKNIWKGITNNFGDIVNNVSQLGQKIYNGFSGLKVPLTNAGLSISNGLLGGLVSKFPEILTGVAGVITSIGGAFMGILETIGGVLTSLGIPTGVLMLAGGVAIAAAIAGVVASLGGSGSSVNQDYSSYPGTSGYDSSTGSTTSTGSYYPSSSTSGVSASDLRSAVHDGCYNAFLDIFQRYGDEITGGKEIKLFIDGKQITASVEKQQADRGVQIMGTEVYSY